MGHQARAGRRPEQGRRDGVSMAADRSVRSGGGVATEPVRRIPFRRTQKRPDVTGTSRAAAERAHSDRCFGDQAKAKEPIPEFPPPGPNRPVRCSEPAYWWQVKILDRSMPSDEFDARILVPCNQSDFPSRACVGQRTH
jgi:hypothetical protein